MCRNIRRLHNFEPPTTDDEVRDSEAIKGRQRHEKRMEREVRIRTAAA